MRVTETPNAVMTTYASPTLGSTELSVWRVEMKASAQGPVHVMDSEQVWTGLSGHARASVPGEDTDRGTPPWIS
jgi:quercetin dioxygenase-like cupin family protein